MTILQFRESLKQNSPPNGLSHLLKSLWYDARGDWHQAHEIAQEIHSASGSWIHAYLHRKEGDISNASYWYHMANKPLPSQPLEEEWETLVVTFLRSN
jgi:hypothetical protein